MTHTSKKAATDTINIKTTALVDTAKVIVGTLCTAAYKQ